jgi:hypothetical protein
MVLLNLAAIVFLSFVAGPLMRRFGLRLGLALNPAVVGGLLVAMAAVVAGPGAAAYGLFVLAAVARVADIVLSDGATRTSVNAAFQVVPIRERLAVQTVVEGIGVPVAIGATGVVLLALNLLGLGIGAVIAFGVLLGVLWTVSGAVLYRSYMRVLADQMRRSPLATSTAAVAEDDTALQALLRSDDARDVRLGLDLLQGVASMASTPALRHASEHPDPAVRVQALLHLADGGDAAAGVAVTRLARELAASADPAERCAAAAALGSSAVSADRRSMLVSLLDDADPAVRAAALDAVRPEDAHDGEIVRRAVAAVEVPRTAGSAAAALRLLGRPAVPLLQSALAREPSPRPALVRAAAHAASGNGLAVIEPALRSGDRVVVLSAIDAMEAVANAGIVPRDLLDAVLDDAAAHAGRALAALGSLTDDDGALRRALEDELDLARRLVIGVLALRHGARVRDAARVIEVAEGQRRALGIEALDVLLARDEAAVAIPLVRRELTAERLAAALKHVVSADRPRERWIADLADDPDGAWRSPWLALCARHAAGR